MSSINSYYHEIDGLEHDAGDVAPHVGVAEEGTEEREDVDSASPLADVVGGLGVLLTKHPP